VWTPGPFLDYKDQRKYKAKTLKGHGVDAAENIARFGNILHTRSQRKVDFENNQRI
jgi:hypothetical protein